MAGEGDDVPSIVEESIRAVVETVANAVVAGGPVQLLAVNESESSGTGQQREGS